MTTEPAVESRFSGSLLGLALGDAMGAPFEGLPPTMIAQKFPTLPSFFEDDNDEPLQYTDDTQLAIGIAETLVDAGTVDERRLCEAFAENFEPWRGYGGGALRVISAMKEGGDYKFLSENLFPGGSYGNGAAMRVGPVGLFFHHDLDAVWEQARRSALPTHVHPLGIEGAQILAAAVALGCRGTSHSSHNVADFVHPLQQRCRSDEFGYQLSQLGTLASPDELASLGNSVLATGSVVTAIGCFLLHPRSFPDAVAQAIRLGGDTDTLAAMTGSISGAALGAQQLPSAWLERLEDGAKGRSYIRELAVQLHQRYAETAA